MAECKCHLYLTQSGVGVFYCLVGFFWCVGFFVLFCVVLVVWVFFFVWFCGVWFCVVLLFFFFSFLGTWGEQKNLNLKHEQFSEFFFLHNSIDIWMLSHTYLE